jgi:bacillithiol system protein YtxJ
MVDVQLIQKQTHLLNQRNLFNIPSMNWLKLVNENQLEEIQNNSFNPTIKGVVLFKHSTRCSISSMALSRFERGWSLDQEKAPAYYLDLLNYRHISSLIADKYAVEHESPQVLIIKDGKCIYHASHSDINVADIEKALNN